ncbi:MAG: hypothetical protein ACYDC8_10935, partial [Gammaproteobacteria bacterium]
VYNSWLDAAGKDGLDLVREPIRAWLSAHKTDSEASHVYNSWLDAAGKDGLDLVREPIRAWLSAHKTDSEASHVYKAWLDAAGKDGLDLVREPIRAWLNLHGDSFEADHVFRAWLVNEGEFSLVADAAAKWLRTYRGEYEASYVTKPLAWQKSLAVPTIRDILYWARTFCHDDDALFRTTQLGSKLLKPEIADDLIETAEVLLNSRQGKLHPPATWLFNLLCSYLICAKSLDDRDRRARVNSWFVGWLLRPSSFLDTPRPSIQRTQFVERLADLLYGSSLDVERDRESLLKFLRWINLWSNEKKAMVKAQIEELSVAFPNREIWGTVVFNDHY